MNNIFQFKKAKCQMQNFVKQEIKEISNGLIVTKNVEKMYLNQDCNKYNINIMGNNLIKFKNCIIKINESVYEN